MLARTRGALLGLAMAAFALAGCSDGGGADADGLDDEDFDELGLQADSETGILRGVVVDAAIRPLAGVVVTATGPESTNVTMTTKDDGLFGFGALVPGEYFINVVKAGYAPIQSAGTVVAGDADPEPVRIQMEADPSNAPYVQVEHMDGFIQCSARAMIMARQCGLTSEDIVNGNYDLARRPDYIQSELRWDSTQAFGDELSLSIRCYPGEETDPAGKCPDGQMTIVRSEGKTPQVGRINQTLIEQWALGGEGGNPQLHVSLFAYGRSDLDVYDEPTIDATQKPVTGNDCMQWGLVGQSAFGFDPATCMRATGPGLIVNQKADVYTHIFYGYTPPADWTFGEDGDPPAPPA